MDAACQCTGFTGCFTGAGLPGIPKSGWLVASKRVQKRCGAGGNV